MKFIFRTVSFFVRASLALFLILAQAVLLIPPQEAAAAPAERPKMTQPPSVSLNVPAEAFIGSNVNFTVTFDNPDANDPGYGPLIDLIIPNNGADGAQNTNPPLDGLTFISATYLGSSIENTVLTFPGSSGVTCVNHPYMRDNTGAFVQVCGNAGDTLVALRLPFGSFTPDQPPLTVNVTASMSNLADLGTPLTIQARGGYQFGYTPLDDWCCGDNPSLTFSGWTSDSVTPTLFTLSKTYNGPEDETATGPNFPRQYTVTAEIAPGQNMTAFNLTDVLPNNMQFVSLVSTNPAATCSTPSTVIPGGTLSCNFSGSVSGTVTMTFEYYIPLRDAGGASVINPSTGDDATSCNNASGGGTWVPIDLRDTGATFTQDPFGCEHILIDKSIATQKSVSVVGGGQPAPGAVLEYVVDVQISDFFVFDQVTLTDIISDGQRFDTTFTPTLQIIGNPASLNSSGGFNAANYTVSPNYTPADLPPNDGTTTITFRISDEMITRSADGRLIGGCVPPGGVAGDPTCSGYNDGPTTARVIFRTVIQEDFSDTFPSGDSSVDQGDVLDNIEFVNGRILSTTDASTPTGSTEADDSSASVSIGRGALTKAIYAVNGNTSYVSPVRVGAGDTVTFRLTYSLITSDFEDLFLTDYLPLPIFDSTEVMSHSNTVCGVPAAGTSCLGPSDTYHSLPAAVNPTVSSDGISNWTRWTYGDYDAGLNTTSTIDIVFTVTVQDDPFADDLHLTNQAYVTEGSTNGTPGEAASIIEITYTAPVMTTTKSVVATDNPSPTFTPPLPIAFTAPGSGPVRWSGTINSNLLDTTPIDSDVSGLDAGDLVTFAIFLVNEGTGINGAFDIVIQDTFDALGFEYPTPGDPNSLNLQIYYGNGSGPISYTDLSNNPTPADTLFTTGIKLVDPVGQGVCAAHDPNLGNNVIIITYDLRMRSDVAPGTYPNTAALVNYSGSEGGPNFLPQPLSDDATVTTDDPQLTKTLVGTEFNTPQNSNTQAVIGEFVTYTLTLTAPEGILQNAQIVDTLDAGLAFVDLQSVTVSNPDTDGAGTGDEGIYSSVMTFNAGGSCTNCTAGTGVGSNPLISAFGGQDGRQITFDFGALVNTNRDNNTPETITITYRAVVLNVAGNQGGGQRNNSAALTWLNDSLPPVSAPDITIIEPVINTAKSVLPATADAGDTVTFTVTLTNPASGSTTAYDVSFSDTLPGSLTYVPGTLALGACTASTPLTLSDALDPTLTGSGGLFQPGESCIVTFQATVSYSAAPGQVITNTAVSQWTSLSGSVSDRSTFNTDSDERTGADGVGGALNDYASQGAANLTINNVTPQKSLVSTSELHTGSANVVIGEIVRYRLVVQLPEGSSANFQIRDNLPGGLTYLDDGTARLALLSNGTPIVSSEPTGSTLALALGNGPFSSGPWVSGSDPTSVTPTYVLPDQNVGSSNSLTADADTYNNGTDPFFKLGTLTNNDNDADAEYVIVEFNALVNNTAAGSNDAGDTRTNNFSVFINGTQNGPNSNNVQVSITEPLLTLAKALTTAPTDAGDPITYTLTITSASGATRATAFDLTLTDNFDANLTGLSVSSVVSTQGAVCTGNGSGATAFSHNGGSFTGNNLTFTATCLDPGQTITITVTGTVIATVPTGYVIPNTANLVYTSLPGANGTTSNPTGSSTPGGSGTDTGERDGSDGVGGAVDDYAATSSASAPLAAPQIDKLTPSPSAYVIGEQITFNILVTLPEGVAQNLQVADDLPLGLQYVSHQVITSAASSGGLLAADYNGAFTNTLPNFACSGICGSGDDISLDFGSTTTTADNVTNNNSFLVQVVARVLNVAGNQNGTVLTNTATVSWTGGSASDSVNVTILEPELDIQKTANDSTWLYGQTVTFTLTVSHLPTSTADAYDLTVTDAIPNVLTYVPGSITASAGCAGNDSGAPNLTWTCATLALGNTATLTYQVAVNSPPTPPFLAG
ncbi:MAG: isopeptide-forming domain-containing fimbrial protein, partial [Chloroflexi bacterium]|nr:isopeptide-forming domain-containing fimbrial protein [Chloroflexota bacterium]